MASKKTSPKDKVPVLVAIIGLVGTLVAAIIGIFPNLINSNKPGSPTLVSFHKFDDLSDIFSIDYPFDYYVVGRKVTTSDIFVLFHPTQEKGGSIMVGVYYPPSNNGSVRDQAERIMNRSLGNSQKRLISVEKKNKGYLVQFEEKTDNELTTNYYVLLEGENNVVAYVIFDISNESPYYHNTSVIEHVLSSFSWSYIKFTESFKP